MTVAGQAILPTCLADTAHGHSGSAILNNSLQLLALHSTGRIKRDQNGFHRLVNAFENASALEGEHRVSHQSKHATRQLIA